MNCPKCRYAIVSLRRSCGGCGYNYGEELYDKFEFYFGLKDELDKLTKLQNSLYAGIANVSLKIQKYEEVLRRDLINAPVGPADSGGKATRRKRTSKKK